MINLGLHGTLLIYPAMKIKLNDQFIYDTTLIIETSRKIQYNHILNH